MYDYPVPYLSFLAHFHIDHDYFECHEVLEEHWKETNGTRDSVWVGLIQTAVFLYHYRRGNCEGAKRMAAKALQCFSRNQAELANLGIDPGALSELISHTSQRMLEGAPFQPMTIPIIDQNVLKELDRFAHTFQGETDKQFLTDKHLLRDRSDVIQARAAAISLKKAGKITTRA